MSSNILIISSEFPPGPGGIGQHAYSLAQSLFDSGYSIKVLSPADYATDDEVTLFDSSQNFSIIRYPRRGHLTTYLYRLKITYAIIRTEKISTIFLTGKFSLWQGYIIKKLYPLVKTLAILHGSEINLPNPLLRWLTHHSISAANVLIPVSKFTLSLVPLWIQNKHHNIVIIPNGVNQKPFQSTAITSINLNGYPRLLTVGHVSPRKGQHRVIRALPTLIKKYPTIHYHIVGRPQNVSALEHLASELDVTDHITFHGRIPNHNALGMYYSQADIFMLLSENQPNGDVEGFGIVALEANLHGLPVIGAKYCGVEEAVSHCNSGFLVDGDNFEEISEGVNYCLNHKEKLKKEALHWVEKHRWSEIVKYYIALLD